MLTNHFLDGQPSWADVSGEDVPALAAFYEKVFGWQFISGGPEAGGYGMFTLDGKTVAAAGPCQENGPNWMLYFQTSDADETVARIEEAGGTVRQPVMQVFDAGRLAQATDPTGADFAVWEPMEVKGLDLVTHPGAFFWTELYTGDARKAKDFYQSVFGWRYNDQQMAPEDPMDVYSIVSVDGDEDKAQGGLVQLPESMLAESGPYWQPYFFVTDCDAVARAATEAGGQILMGPLSMPGVGRLASLTDPQGALFSVITPSPE
ncbi:VOC family protein [Salininema proteolyticum]|uniref:VOC family protein n=1 Tax=Salininema proteolyticum TaxID=1607685 RepID=A0ABV8U0P5_9ACTN